MRICGFAVDSLKGEREIFEGLPTKELQDYWSTHPRYETYADGPSFSGGDQVTDTTDSSKWKGSSGKNALKDEPPPPYVFEDSVIVPTAKVWQHHRFSSMKPSSSCDILYPISHLCLQPLRDHQPQRYRRHRVRARPRRFHLQ